MTTASQWLRAKAPGFVRLANEELDAITDFALLWSLFESRLLNTRGNAHAICKSVDAWYDSGALDPGLFADELAYFKVVIFAVGRSRIISTDFTSTHTQIAKPWFAGVLDGSDTDPRHVETMGNALR